ncbi:glycerol-3-phosphate 1-O-acyltransferase PlsY (plasmid) [Cytobacillus spongiae]|uniref:glycerol-3-phosphate 1-O-acyltransferase PlsY n=1 Tax=Cytobacillus spongiae TaxID=2901381 RepID=UPI00145E88A5|nr:glycerol-3-phosphate 1-O-acyltransferase PlsY [Cytobacillus spongiae]MCA1062739.1 glycerol-3-phosphate 1-O-acyltransferase PlsY [Rossellomorea aquimaris]NMH70077.1 glycerol-3-phosphate 1-O-acyltransferase PlsY [Bacillus sp. RO3]UII58367.1 glycerol-3-phosphate 1-O-acyltransferase PlsY [Cytobacillus spongiae]WJV28599.1 glycerol-3-phosphate 1-O-acyltransferase PlsY [Rossellomorea sp. AcN35-11]
MIFALILVLSYLLGSIPSGLLIGKTFYGKDIREHGSGNLGGTNTFRTLGVKAGMIVTIMDILKGTVATLLPLLLASDVHMLLAGVFAVIGHMYPVFANFRGGKAVATSAGVLLGYHYILFLILLVVFFLCLYVTKYVSLSSMIAAVLAFTYSIFTGDVPLIIVVGILTLFVVYRHRANIIRIKNKTEPKIKWL